MGANTDRLASPLDAKILLADVEVVGQNPYGEVRFGRLVSHGLTYEAWEVNEDEGLVHMDPIMDDPGKALNGGGSSSCEDTLAYTLLLVCFLGFKSEDPHEAYAQPCVLVLAPVEGVELTYHRVGFIYMTEQSPAMGDNWSTWKNRSVTII